MRESLVGKDVVIDAVGTASGVSPWDGGGDWARVAEVALGWVKGARAMPSVNSPSPVALPFA
jgi:hypothetical protein